MDYALIGNPLSDGFRAKFELEIGVRPHYIGLSELRRLSVAALVKRLLGLKAKRLFLVLEGESSRALLPVYYGLASLCSAREIRLVFPDLRSELISRRRACQALASTVFTTLGGQLSLRRCRREAAALLSQPRLELPPPKQGTVLYLKSNLSTGIKAGGSVGHIAGVANALVAGGYPVDFAGLEAPEILDPAIPIIPLQAPRAYGVPHDMNLYPFQETIVRQLLAHQPSRPYTFIYQRLSIGNYAGVILSRHNRVPLVLEYNGSETWTAKNWSAPLRYQALAEAAEEVCLKHAHLVLTISQVLADELVARGVAPERVVWYPNGIDPQTFDPARFSAAQSAQLRAKFGIAPTAVVAAFVGTFGPWHGAEVFAAALRRAVEETPDWLRAQRVHCMFVGDGAGMSALRQLLADERCRPFYTLTGLVPQAEAPAYLATADILVSPHVDNADGSRFFGSPTKLFEYMAMGRAILASDLEQIGAVLEPGLRCEDLPADAPDSDERARAVLCRPGDVAGLLRGLRFLVERPAWRGALGANARRAALAEYTWDQHVGAFLARLAAC
jgi:glycosyltransferase involved in cell wall biosynthesis